MPNYQQNDPIPFWKLLFFSMIAGVVFTFIFSNWSVEQEWQILLRNYVTQVIYCMVIWKVNEVTVHLLNRWISWFDQPFLRFWVSTIATIAVTLGAIILLSATFNWLYYNQLPLAYLRKIDVFNYWIAMLITGIISLFIHGHAFLTGWRESVIEVEKLKQANIVAQYETLKNQVNPHFLFNSLNVLSSLVYKDQDLAAKFIKQLSKVYRYVLETREKEVVSLQRELDALESYIFLMKIRFGENLLVHQNVQPKPKEQIVPLTLQMLLENVIKHNEVSKAFPLSIEILRMDNGYISMKNNIQEKKQLSEKSGVGLANIQSRFQYISDKKVEILKTEAVFEVKIPIVEME